MSPRLFASVKRIVRERHDDFRSLFLGALMRKSMLRTRCGGIHVEWVALARPTPSAKGASAAPTRSRLISRPVPVQRSVTRNPGDQACLFDIAAVPRQKLNAGDQPRSGLCGIPPRPRPVDRAKGMEQ